MLKTKNILLSGVAGVILSGLSVIAVQAASWSGNQTIPGYSGSGSTVAAGSNITFSGALNISESTFAPFYVYSGSTVNINAGGTVTGGAAGGIAMYLERSNTTINGLTINSSASGAGIKTRYSSDLTLNGVTINAGNAYGLSNQTTDDSEVVHNTINNSNITATGGFGISTWLSNGSYVNINGGSIKAVGAGAQIGVEVLSTVGSVSSGVTNVNGVYIQSDGRAGISSSSNNLNVTNNSTINAPKSAGISAASSNLYVRDTTINAQTGISITRSSSGATNADIANTTINPTTTGIYANNNNFTANNVTINYSSANSGVISSLNVANILNSNITVNGFGVNMSKGQAIIQNTNVRADGVGVSIGDSLSASASSIDRSTITGGGVGVSLYKATSSLTNSTVNGTATAGVWVVAANFSASDSTINSTQGDGVWVMKEASTADTLIGNATLNNVTIDAHAIGINNNNTTLVNMTNGSITSGDMGVVTSHGANTTLNGVNLTAANVAAVSLASRIDITGGQINSQGSAFNLADGGIINVTNPSLLTAQTAIAVMGSSSAARQNDLNKLSIISTAPITSEGAGIVTTGYTLNSSPTQNTSNYTPYEMDLSLPSLNSDIVVNAPSMTVKTVGVQNVNGDVNFTGALIAGTDGFVSYGSGTTTINGPTVTAGNDAIAIKSDRSIITGTGTVRVFNIASTDMTGTGHLFNDDTGTAQITVNAVDSNLIGDSFVTVGSRDDFNLTNSTLTGSIVGLNNVAIDSKSVWNMPLNTGTGTYTGTNDNIIVGNVANDGNINFGYNRLSSDDYQTFNKLNIAGNFSGSGNLYMNTNLGQMMGDHIAVNGSTAGTQVVFIRNGGPNPTSHTGLGPTDGLQIISVGGSSAGNYVLGAPVVVGIYDYALNKADGQNWYLQNGVDPTPDPRNPNGPYPPVGPRPPHVVDTVPGYVTVPDIADRIIINSFDNIRNGIDSSQLDGIDGSQRDGIDGLDGSQRDANNGYADRDGNYYENRTVWCKDPEKNFRCRVPVPVLRTAAPKLERNTWSVWSKGVAYTGDYKSTYKYGANGLIGQVGLDYSIRSTFSQHDRIRLGAFAGYAETWAKLDGLSSKVDLRGPQVGLYTIYNQDGRTSAWGRGWTADAMFVYSWLKSDITATAISGHEIRAKYDVNTWGVSTNIGYGFALGNRTVLRPVVGYSFINVETPAFTDSAYMAVQGSSHASNIVSAGARLEYRFDTQTPINGWIYAGAEQQFGARVKMVANEVLLNSASQNGTRGVFAVGLKGSIAKNTELFGSSSISAGKGVEYEVRGTLGLRTHF